MKKFIFALTLIFTALQPYHSKAQVSVSFNIASQPLWGPVGYERVEYYYLPDIETYYNVPQRQFVFLSNDEWVFANILPARYSNYDLYSGYKVVIKEPKPYLSFEDHKIRYARFKNIHTQPVIIRSDDPKYFVIKGHPKHPHGMPPGQAKKLISGSNGKMTGKGKK